MYWKYLALNRGWRPQLTSGVGTVLSTFATSGCQTSFSNFGLSYVHLIHGALVISTCVTQTWFSPPRVLLPHQRQSLFWFRCEHTRHFLKWRDFSYIEVWWRFMQCWREILVPGHSDARWVPVAQLKLEFSFAFGYVGNVLTLGRFVINVSAGLQSWIPYHACLLIWFSLYYSLLCKC